ncbi:flagellar hook-length control protein FliK [Roseibium sp.]|uniref:flagellar hook-length control protein FliK n=1 Tax=Roseibium sp. TaxID=1936156 RepID=UPI003B515843
MLPIGMMTELTQGPVQVKAAGGLASGSTGGSGNEFQQFSEELQSALQEPGAELPVEVEGDALPVDLSGELEMPTSSPEDGVGGGMLEAAQSTDMSSPDAGLVFAEAQESAVPGYLGVAWQADAGIGDLADDGRVEVAGREGIGSAGAASRVAEAPSLPQVGMPAAAGEAGKYVKPAVSAGVPGKQAGSVPNFEVSAEQRVSAGNGPLTGAGEADVNDAGAVTRSIIVENDPELVGSDTKAVDRPNGVQAVETNSRRWQEGLPQELRADTPNVQRFSESTLSQPVQELAGLAVQSERVGDVKPGVPIGAAEVPAADGAQAPEHDLKPRVWRSEPVSTAPGAEVASLVRQASGAPFNGAAGASDVARYDQADADIKLVRPVQAADAKPAQGVVAPAPQTAGALAGQVLPQTLSRSDASLSDATARQSEDVPFDLGGEEMRPGPRLADEVRMAGSRSVGVDGQAQAGSPITGQPKIVTPQNSIAAAASGQSQVSEIVDDLVVDGAGTKAGLEAELADEPDFVATLRGGDMQGAARTEALQTPTQAQSSQVATQVAVEMARNLKNAQTRFQMRFDPPELGRVDVNMKVAADGSVQAHLIVERPETLDMFLRDQRGLERALEAAGLNTNSNDLQFSLKQEAGQQFASGEDHQQNQSGQSSSGKDGAADDGAAGEIIDRELLQMTLAEQRGGLDIRI